MPTRPHAVFLSIVESPPRLGLAGIVQKDLNVGKEAQLTRWILALKNPIEHGMVNN